MKTPPSQSPAFDPTDRLWMRRCVQLAQQGAGRTSPNPMVGSVVVQDGVLVGEGFHPGAGQPHAEVFAIAAAGDRTPNATLYVNLEPCNHYGRTPPCTEAILKAGIRRVVVGMVDPDPRVSGTGIARLRAAGLEVTVGVEEAACQRLNEGFVHRVTQHRPLGILKYAMTLDGKIATTTGHSTWVTGAQARTEVHRLRAACDAVIVGGNTVRKDNPYLTTHGQSEQTPLRVVMSRTLDLPAQAHLWDTQLAPTLVFTTPLASPQRQQGLVDRGIEVVCLENLSTRDVMEHLYGKGCAMVLWECGGQLAAQAIAERMVQKVWAFVAPKIIGGKDAPSPVGDLNLTQMNQAIPLRDVSWRSLEQDLLLEGYLDWPEPA